MNVTVMAMPFLNVNRMSAPDLDRGWRLKDTIAVFGRSAEGVDFESPDNAPSHHICLLLVPEDKAAQHLQTLSELAKVFSQSVLRKRLEEATTAEAICEIFHLASS